MGFFSRRRRKPDKEPVDPRPPEPPPETVFDVRRAQLADDSPSWHGSWERLSDRVHVFLKAKFGRVQLPYDVEFDDLFSAVLVRMLRDLPRLRVDGRAEFWAWVRRLAKNQVVDYWRSHGRQRTGGGRVQQQQPDPEAEDLIAQTPDEAAPTASVILRMQEIEDAEAECVAQLPNERVRKIYDLRRRKELPFADIAAEVGDSSADVTRVAFRRAKEKVLLCLRSKLDGYEGPAQLF